MKTSQKISNQTKNWLYWGSIVLLIDLIIVSQSIWHFTSTGQCRNYMILGSQLQTCSWGQFLHYGYNWLSFSNAFVFLPAIAIMVFATQIVDVIFAKRD